MKYLLIAILFIGCQSSPEPKAKELSIKEYGDSLAREGVKHRDSVVKSSTDQVFLAIEYLGKNRDFAKKVDSMEILYLRTGNEKHIKTRLRYIDSTNHYHELLQNATK
jgi:hypothetical protein